MIGKLRGIIDELAQDYLTLDVGGVGYTVFADAKTLASMPPVGEHAALFTETHVREDHIHLYGFLSKEARAWFRLLTTVQGVGVKMALAILSLYGGTQLAQMIAAQDKHAMTAVSGVGPKLAERIITELKNKAHTMPGAMGMTVAATPVQPAQAVDAGDTKSGKSGKATKAKKTKKAKQSEEKTVIAPIPVADETTVTGDAVSALAHLGFGRAEAFASVSRYLSQTPDASLDDIIKHSLKELAA